MSRLVFPVVFIVVFCLWSAGGIAYGEGEVDDFVRALDPYAATRAFGGTSEEPQVTMHLRFGKNSAAVSAEDKPRLRTLGKALYSNKIKKYIIKIEGHTCDLGRKRYNKILSEKRAMSVLHFLVRNCHLPQSRFISVGFGESKPIVPNTDEANRRLNRRVVIKNTCKKIAAGSEDEFEKARIGVEIKVLCNGVEMRLPPKGIISAKDNYAIELNAQSECYAHIFHIDHNGQKTTIFPNTKFSHHQNPLNAGRFYRFPPYGQWFTFDNKPGEETIVVIAGKKLIPDAERISDKISENKKIRNRTNTGRRFKEREEELDRRVIRNRPDSSHQQQMSTMELENIQSGLIQQTLMENRNDIFIWSRTIKPQ